MRKLATIARISTLSDIPGADSIEKATIRGWELVVKKHEFRPGDLCVYVEVDSILPDRAEFEFMRSRKFRVKTIKLRGQISQGIAFPLTVLPGNISKYDEGDDVTSILGIVKYDPQAEIEAKELLNKKPRTWLDKKLMRYAWYRKLRHKKDRGAWPSWIPKTDEERIQNMMKEVRTIWENDTPVLITEKLDGSSITCFVERKRKWFGTIWEFGVCSRNFRLLEEGGRYWEAVKTLAVKWPMIQHCKINGWSALALQGELIGPGIQKNRYELMAPTIRFFTVLSKQGRIPPYEAHDYLRAMHLPAVPVLHVRSLPKTLEECLTFAEGRSAVNLDTEREGVVVRTKDDVSFKIISNKYLLNNE